MSQVTDAERIAAEGVEVTLADGETRRLRFDLRALLTIEQRMGSVAIFAKGLDDSLAGRGIESLAVGISAGLGLDEDTVLGLLDTHRLRDYLVAVVTALDEAVSQHEGTGKDSAPGNDSRGPTSTDSPVATSAAATGTSGT